MKDSKPDIIANNTGGHVFCPKCKLVTCVCKLSEKHKPDCRYLIAARCPVEFECEHGAQACPICDPCDCGAGETRITL